MIKRNNSEALEERLYLKSASYYRTYTAVEERWVGLKSVSSVWNGTVKSSEKGIVWTVETSKNCENCLPKIANTQKLKDIDSWILILQKLFSLAYFGILRNNFRILLLMYRLYSNNKLWIINLHVIGMFVISEFRHRYHSKSIIM